MLGNLIAGSLREMAKSEMLKTIFKNVTIAMSRFVVINFCTYCLDFEWNLS